MKNKFYYLAFFLCALTLGLTSCEKEDVAGGLFYGVSVGARYWFTEALGVNLEAGYGLSFLKAGINFRF